MVTEVLGKRAGNREVLTCSALLGSSADRGWTLGTDTLGWWAHTVGTRSESTFRDEVVKSFDVALGIPRRAKPECTVSGCGRLQGAAPLSKEKGERRK